MHGEMSICASQDLFALARGARSPAFTRLLEVPIRRPASGATYVKFEGCTASTQEALSVLAQYLVSGGPRTRFVRGKAGHVPHVAAAKSCNKSD